MVDADGDSDDAGTVEDEEAVVDAKKDNGDGYVASSAVRGTGMECLRSGIMGRQLEEVERRSLRVVRQDFCTFKMEETSSSWEGGSSWSVFSVFVW